ncbi:hypothetical protein ES703_119930 [subsurface metagenome]
MWALSRRLHSERITLSSLVSTSRHSHLVVQESEEAVAQQVLQSISPARDDALDARHGMINHPQVMGGSTYYAEDLAERFQLARAWPGGGLACSSQGNGGVWVIYPADSGVS